jgi:hypothetical protein
MVISTHSVQKLYDDTSCYLFCFSELSDDFEWLWLSLCYSVLKTNCLI